jgi:inosine-uridine nucleoside N-ribohydrolase
MKLLRLLPCLLLSGITLFAAAKPVPVVLDTDIGDDIDDALALSLALQSPELKVLAVSTVLQHGDERAALVWKILELYGRTDIPVGVGAEQTLMGKPRTGDVVQAKALPAGFHAGGERVNGIELLLDTIRKSPEKVTVLAYGPLTNIALLLRADASIRGNIERIVLMNGVFFRPGLEYNTMMDAEASAIVYSSGIPIETVGLDVTMQCRLSQSDMRRLESSKLDTVSFLLQLIRLWQGKNPDAYPILHDPLAIAVAVKPDLVYTQRGSVKVETHGTPDETYGMTIFRKDASGNVTVANEVSSAKVIDFFLSRVLAPPRKP